MKNAQAESSATKRQSIRVNRAHSARSGAGPKQRLAAATNQVREQRILNHLAAGEQVTQRALSRELGIALGLTNLIVRRLVTKGWVRVRRVSPNRILYLVTPAGVAAKARLTRSYVRETMLFYRATRDSLQAQFARLSDRCAAGPGRVPVVFYGAGDIAEIAYVCLQDTPLELVGLVDPAAGKPFFGMPVWRPEDLGGTTLAGRAFIRLIVTAVENEDDVKRMLAQRGVPDDCVWWL